MKNAIKYYYNLNPTNIHQINKKIKFYINNNIYILYPTTKNNEEIKDIYKLHINLISRGIYCHKIILNINNEIISLIENNKYALLEINAPNRIIELNDIMYYANIRIENNEFLSIQRQEWKKLWINKIEYIEYQMNQIGKNYKILNESCDYYIGIVENCISLMNNILDKNTYLTINHNRLNSKTTIEEFYNPFEFILDISVRDIGEYVKNAPTDKVKIIENFINSKMLSNNEIQLLFIRILYPSTYFDIYDEIINGKKEEKELEKYISEVEHRETEIKKIYHFIRSISNLPEIEWLN